MTRAHWLARAMRPSCGHVSDTHLAAWADVRCSRAGILPGVRFVGDAKSSGGAGLRGVLRLLVLVTLGVIALSFSVGEPLGNRIFLWILAGSAFAIAAWGLIETLLELRRVRRNR